MSDELLDVKMLARRYTKAAVCTLAELCVGAKSEQARILAAKIILERGYGMPNATVDVVHGLSDEALELAAKQIIERRSRPALPPPKQNSEELHFIDTRELVSKFQ